jgi:UPF0755 protein
LLSLLGVSAFLSFYFFPKAPLSYHHEQIEFEILPGESVRGILKRLKTEKILSSYQAFLFKYYIRSLHAEKKIQAGEYKIWKDLTPQALLQKWMKGDVILYSVTFPEGITAQAAIQILEKHPKIKAQPLEIGLENEGLYYPDTYYFAKNTSNETILKRANEIMKRKLSAAWEARDRAIVINSPYEALILASIIEKETALSSEKPLISGVFQRRLTKKMRLQADPTVIYGLQASFTGRLTKEDLKNPSPYNTYVHQGLPPTPIALPGMVSIEAALHPQGEDFLYFVAKGDGSHQFSATLEEHNEAVKKYIRTHPPSLRGHLSPKQSSLKTSNWIASPSLCSGSQ